LEIYKILLDLSTLYLPTSNKPLELRFKDRLKRARLDLTGGRGGVLSPEKLGAMLGVSGQTIRNWESGATEPSLDMIAQVAKVLGPPVTAGYLAFGERGEDMTKYAPADQVPAGAYETIEERDRRVAAGKAASKKKRA
jgi:transcriptional regulator with XRE-family HTH domain